jgi:hypothetical protein
VRRPALEELRRSRSSVDVSGTAAGNYGRAPDSGAYNNAVERALRGPVVGRKNHYGSKSKRGTKVAAILYTLCETAKLCGVDPWRYLAIAAKRAVNEPGLITLPQPGGGIHSY